MLTEKTASAIKPMWHLYIIENRLCQLYTGITTDPQRRFDEHSQNSPRSAKALRGKGPLTMRYCIAVGNKSEALRLELWVKRQSRQNKLKLIDGSLHLPSAETIHE